jgi:hypothetical protein
MLHFYALSRGSKSYIDYFSLKRVADAFRAVVMNYCLKFPRKIYQGHGRNPFDVDMSLGVEVNFGYIGI